MIMERIRPDDCIPVIEKSSLATFKTDKDLIYLGKENLQHLARFWKARMEKFSKKKADEPSPFKQSNYQLEIDLCASKCDYLKKLIVRSTSKPAFLEKTIIRIGGRVTCFVPSPDRYVQGTVSKIYVDEESETGSFSIRVYDESLFTKYYDLMYVPDGKTIFLTKDFNYYKTHPDFFRYMLCYSANTLTPSASSFIDRMVVALPQPTPDPPNIA